MKYIYSFENILSKNDHLTKMRPTLLTMGTDG